MGCGVSDNSSDVALPNNDRYERKDLIGVGHHGRVYRCYYHLDKKDYALKIIDQLPDFVDSKMLKSYGMEELHKLKRLRHDRLATYFKVDVQEKEISIVMDLAKEGTLKKYVQKNGTVKQPKVSEFAESILQGLDYLHNAGVLHKDLKSSNVLVMNKQQLKLTDYGLAQLYDKRLASVQSKRRQKIIEQFARGDSLPYMAPEVIKNIEITQKSDVWSLGCIIIELLTSSTPFQTNNQKFEQTFNKISSSVHPPFPTSVSKQCESFLQSCLAVVPSQRSTVRELLKHKFIRIYSKKQELYFEQESIENLKLSPIKQNKSRNQKNKQTSSVNVSPQRQNIEFKQNIPVTVKSKSSSLRESRNYKMTKSSRLIDQNLVKLQEVLKQMDHTKPQKIPVISREDILPEIDEQDDNRTVMLNNKKVRLEPSKYKNNGYKVVNTEQTEWTSPPKYRHQRLSTQPDQNKANDNYYDRRKIHSNNYSQMEDSLDLELKVKKMRMQTQPDNEQYDPYKEYFKKPLRLIKKKLKQNKIIDDFTRQMHNASNLNAQSSGVDNIQSFDGDIIEGKIRSNTQASREDIIINTELARAERDRYINQQKLLRKQRQQQRLKWENQLLNGAQILKKDMSYRYNFRPMALS